MFVNEIKVLGIIGIIGIKVILVNEIKVLGIIGIIGIKVVFVNEKMVRDYDWDYRDYGINSLDKVGDYATKIRPWSSIPNCA